jgi:hypothetical protein
VILMSVFLQAGVLHYRLGARETHERIAESGLDRTAGGHQPD